jgi:hypothetical protein
LLGCSCSRWLLELDRIGFGQHSGNSSVASRRHPVRDLVQSIAEQVAVLVERHGRRSVSDMRVIRSVVGQSLVTG